MKTLSLLIVFTLAACSNIPSAQDKEMYINGIPTSPPHIAEGIRKGLLVKGMTKRDVEMTKGSPCYSCVGTRSNSWGDTWHYQSYLGRYSGYKDSFVFFDRSGRVTGWSMK